MIYLEPYLEYKYKDTFYISKWAAADAASKDGIESHLLFESLQATLARRDYFFGNIDTTVEPSETWVSLPSLSRA